MLPGTGQLLFLHTDSPVLHPVGQIGCGRWQSLTWVYRYGIVAIRKLFDKTNKCLICTSPSATRTPGKVLCCGLLGRGGSNKDMHILCNPNNFITPLLPGAGHPIITVHCDKLEALQESPKPTIMPSDFVGKINALPTTPTDIAVILRVDPVGPIGPRQRPGALAYLNNFTQPPVGWHIVNIALMDQVAIAIHHQISTIFPNANIFRVPNSANRPTNESAQLVRQSWGWW